jgi:sortase A
MKLRFQWRRERASRAQKALRWAERFFFIVGCCALALCAAWYWQARVYQDIAFEELRQTTQEASSDAAPPPVVPLPPRPGQPIGEIEIRRLGIVAAVVEGVGSRHLRLAVGHVPGTALPGERGNIGIAGHRDTFFRSLRHIRAGDTIRLITPRGLYEYSVESTQVVAPSQTEALQSRSEPSVTLVTCYPFYYVGPAPRRFIVRARQIAPGRLN